MKKIVYIAMCVAGLSAATSCDDGFLDTKSPSVVDKDFVFSNMETSRAAMAGAYDAWRAAAQGAVFGDGLFYALDAAGSDIERHPESYAGQTGRHIPETFYRNGTLASDYGLLSYEKDPGSYGSLFSAIGKVNAVINAIETMDGYESMISSGTPTDLSQLYGEAIALRATVYREMIKYYGDVPYQTAVGVAAEGLSPRDYIYDQCLKQLQVVEPLMYRVGEGGVEKNYFSRTYVQGLIGRMALDAAGYQTRRKDLGADFYVDGDGNKLTFENKGTDQNEAFYGRRSDWRDLYALAKTYLQAVVENSGSAKFNSTDPRSTSSGGQVFDNPYQYFFQQMNDLKFADESIYEYAMTQNQGNDARPYSMGRPSNGANANAYPCKSYGQARIQPAFYYGVFDPQDKRRDVSIVVTGSIGASGTEKLMPFSPGNTSNAGGLSTNKWDENRMAVANTLAQRRSGINGPYMRLSEIYLAYAEVCATTGDESTAKTYLTKIRERAFPAGQAKVDEFIASCGSVLNAVIEERGFEFAGEGDRRWTLIRTGVLPDAIRKFKERTKAMLDGLAANGYYTFANGNTISNYVWTKSVDAKSTYGHRLTTQTPAGKENDPVLYPGWRGVNDDWGKYGLNYGTDTPKTNLAIKGLFNYIDPNGAEAAALEADGYAKVNWGADLVTYYDEYYTYMFYDYDYVKAPIHTFPFPPNVVTTGGFTNGYGFKQQ